MFILEVNKKSLFTKFENVYPECTFLIDDEPNLHPLICLRGPCHRQANCMTKLAHRVKAMFDAFPEAELLMLYFKYRDLPNKVRAGVFHSDLREPRYINFNLSAWKKLKEDGTIFEWELPLALRLGA